MTFQLNDHSSGCTILHWDSSLALHGGCHSIISLHLDLLWKVRCSFWCLRLTPSIGERFPTLPTNNSQNISWVSENSPQFWHYLHGDSVRFDGLRDESYKNSQPPPPTSPTSFILFCIFWLHHTTACGILAQWPAIKPSLPALEAQSLNHWTSREVPHFRDQLQTCTSDHPATDGGSYDLLLGLQTPVTNLGCYLCSDQLGINQRSPGSFSLGLINLLEQLTELRETFYLLDQ